MKNLVQRKTWIAMFVICVAAFAAYGPALRAGWIWDDDCYILDNPAVQLPGGVLDAWVPGSTPQYYPLVFVSFWVQHGVHGLDPYGYHLANVLLHVGSSIMLWRLLRRMCVPGSLLAAGLFALHPVQVETVAWVTERKNVLSMAFALASLISWVRFLQDMRPFAARAGWWGLSFVLFAMAMLSKTTAVAVPVAMVAIAWWRPWDAADDRPELARPALPMRATAVLAVPFFVLGIAMGLFTAWVEATLVGARGAEFARPAMERLMQAAQAWWFYLGTWVWPHGLMFVYPAFDGPAWLPWLALLAGISVAVAAFVAARRGVRGPMVAFLCYSAGVFPALGFINLYPLRFAPVADHFGYVASAVLAPAAAWCLLRALRAAESRGLPVPACIVAAMVLLGGLAVASNAHAVRFANAETLWRASLADNPRAWLASNNLVEILLNRVQSSMDAGDAAGRDAALAEASQLAELSVSLAGSIDMPVQSNLGEVRRLQGRLPEALTALNAAIAIQPEAPGPYWQRGRIVELLGRVADAGPEYAHAVELSPRSATYLRDYARWLVNAGRIADARSIAARIAALDPQDAEALANLGSLELELGEVQPAREHLLRALAIAEGDLSTVVAVRAVRACLTAPVQPASAQQARAISDELVAMTRGQDPIALLLLARSQAAMADPAARATLARADTLLATADAEVRTAAAPERAAAEAAIALIERAASPTR
jgi:tetratricopeptide (TPR) repeat protein